MESRSAFEKESNNDIISSLDRDSSFSKGAGVLVKRAKGSYFVARDNSGRFTALCLMSMLFALSFQVKIEWLVKV